MPRTKSSQEQPTYPFLGSRLFPLMLRKGIITPGDKVLHVNLRDSQTPIYLGLNDKGTVVYDGCEYSDLSAAARDAARDLGITTDQKKVMFYNVRYKGGKSIKELKKCLSEDVGPETSMEEDVAGCLVPAAWIPLDSDMPSWREFSKPRASSYSHHTTVDVYEKSMEPRPVDWKVETFEYSGMEDEEEETVAMEAEATVNMGDPRHAHARIHTTESRDDEKDDLVLSLDMHVETSDVISRIESVCVFILECIMDETLPTISCHEDGKKSFGLDSEKSLIRFSRMALVLDKVHEILSDPHGKRITQRDMYYMAKVKDRNIKAPQMMELIQDTAQVLHVPRFAMGLDCRSKGLVYGPLVLGTKDVRDCSTRGFPISGSTMEVLQSDVACSASCIIVIEKETLFQRLVGELGRQSVLQSCLLVTACGYPDLATRVLLHKLAKAYPDIPMVGMFDWNPHGVQILCQYKYGSKKSVESQPFKLGNLHWLGVRSPMIRSVLGGNDCLQDLSLRDRALIRSLKVHLEEHGNSAWLQEIQCMEYAGVKADIESLYGHQTMQDFCDTIQKMIISSQWI